MEFLPKEEAAELKGYLDAHLTGPVTLDYFTIPASDLWVPGRQDCETCEDTAKLLAELAALSDRITLRVHDVSADPRPAKEAGFDTVHVPAIVLTGAAKGRVRFLGIPSGLEFATLLRSLIAVATGATSLAAPTKAALRGLEKDVHIRVFVTPTCPYCPRAAQTAVEMAVESEHVTADVVEAEEFPDLADRYHVQGVPKTVINDALEFVGAQPEARFLDQVLRAAA